MIFHGTLSKNQAAASHCKTALMFPTKKAGSGRVSQEAERGQMALGIRIHRSVQGDSAGGKADRGLSTHPMAGGPAGPPGIHPRAPGQDPDLEIARTRRCRSVWDELGWTLALPGPKGTEGTGVLLAPEKTSAHCKELPRPGRTG